MKALYYTVLSSNNSMPDCEVDSLMQFPVIKDINYYCKKASTANIIAVPIALLILLIL